MFAGGMPTPVHAEGTSATRPAPSAPGASLADKSGVRQPSDVHFLGFRFQCRTTERVCETAVLLSAKAERRLKATIRAMTPPNWGRSLTACMDELSRYLSGWMAYFRVCTAEAASGFRAIDAHIRRRLRAIIIHQRKRPPPTPAQRLMGDVAPKLVELTDNAVRSFPSGTAAWSRAELEGSLGQRARRDEPVPASFDLISPGRGRSNVEHIPCV